MPRPRADGTPSRKVHRRNLTDLFVQARKGGERNEMIWDARYPHLALSVRTTGYKSWTVIYRHSGKPRWLLLGDARYIGLADARRLAARAMLDIAEGKDPARERRAQRDSGTFAELASQYVELSAKKHNKSWKTTEKLVARYVLPSLGKLKANAVTRADLRAMMVRIGGPITANQALASASAIFSWAVKQEILTVNPCHGVDRNPTNDRERVLSDAELTTLWPRLEPALKLLLLTGQRPGEVAALQAGHIVEGFWQMPGKPSGDWPGTKNGRDHRVAMSDTALEEVQLHLAARSSAQMTSLRLKKLVAEFELEKVTPHDLRRTALSTVTGLGFGRDAMDRIANHRKGGVTDVYDRHSYADEDRRIMTAVARHVASLVEPTATSNVVSMTS